MTDPRANDEALAVTLNRQVADYERLLLQARRDRRAVWLRLHEEHGMRYSEIATAFGVGETTVWSELKKARAAE